MNNLFVNTSEIDFRFSDSILLAVLRRELDENALTNKNMYEYIGIVLYSEGLIGKLFKRKDYSLYLRNTIRTCDC